MKSCSKQRLDPPDDFDQRTIRKGTIVAKLILNSDKPVFETTKSAKPPEVWYG